MKYLSFAILTTAATWATSQVSNFNTQRNWSFNKKELTFGIGGTNFLGDLGGANQIGTDYSVKDWDFPATSLGGSMSFRYRWHPFYATSFLVNFGRIRGNDANTEEEIRNNRNLHFRSNVINVSQRFEIIAFANEKVGKRYSIHGLKGMGYKATQLYFFTGIGATYFNPKAQYQGNWVNLYDLHTEGQGLTGGPEQYKRVTATIPFGMGFRIATNKFWRVGFEVTYVKTFSDYLDDVGGVYFDPSVLMATYGDASAYLSNPGKTPSWFNPGSMRGDSQKDALFYYNITIAKNITYKSGPRSKIKFKNNFRAKF